MNAADFEINLSLPAEARFATTIRDLAAHAARYAGCADNDADRFAAAVESVGRSCLDRAATGAEVPVILRRGAGPIEFLIGCESQFATATHEGRVTIEWTREQGTSMCRVALDL
jgi:hypothetical protein